MVFKLLTAMTALMGEGPTIRLADLQKIREHVEEFQRITEIEAINAAKEKSQLLHQIACLLSKNAAHGGEIVQLQAQLAATQQRCFEHAQHAFETLFQSPAQCVPVVESSIKRNTALFLGGAFLVYGAKRIRDAYAQVKNDGMVTISLIGKNTGALIVRDMRYLLHIISCGLI